MEKIRILHLIYSLNTGGAERVVENYAKFHDRAFFELVVCCLTGGGFIAERIKESGVEVIMLHKKKGVDFRVILNLIKAIRTRRIEVAHLHNFSANFWGTIAALFCRVPIILRTEHSIVVKKTFIKRVENFVNYLLGFFQKSVIGVSEKVTNSHIQEDFFPSNKYITIYNGIDPSIFEKKSDLKKYFEEFNIDENYMIVEKIASLRVEKGHEYFLKAAKIILDKVRNVIFLIVGDGPKRNELKRLAKELGIKDNIIFTGVREDTSELLKFADLFVLSSLREGFPITILEAMAASKPIVATDVGGNSEAVLHGITGFIVPPQNEEALAEAILSLLKNKKLAKEMGAKGRERVKKEFSAEIMVKKTEDLYKSFLKR